ncbi:MAG TPA: Asp23/Gls24 family envelope stress response protein [Anaerolineales bacterium]|nr:Asp23/Gls24 family envelope stress response protein [Anaerolineales bacterium]
MTDSTRPPGKTTIAPEVLITIARMAALSVPGVSEMAPVAGGVNRFLQRGPGNGVQIAIHENMVMADLFLIVKEEVNIREVGRNVQQQVTRAIREMTGMDVGQVDIHIEDIHYEGSDEA